MEKRGQEMTLGTIILIVLGIAVLVFLIYGFSTGWNNIWDRITNLGGTSSNLDTIRSSCTLACDAKNTAEFCTLARTVKIGSTAVTIDGVTTKSVTASCKQLSENKFTYEGAEHNGAIPGLTVAACPSLC